MAPDLESHSKTVTVALGTVTNRRDSTKKLPRKHYIPIQVQTNATNNDDIAINASYISIEDLAGRDSRKERSDARNVEIRYLESFRNLRDKIKSSYCCNQDHCPKVVERFNQHLLEHHSSPVAQRCTSHTRRGSQTSCNLEQPCPKFMERYNQHQCEHHRRQSQTFSISPRPSILKRPMCSTLNGHQSTQTCPGYSDFNHTTQSSFNQSLCQSDGYLDVSRSYAQSTNDFRPTETKISFTTINCVMKDDLKDVVMAWLEDIPLYPNLTSSNKNLRKYLTNQFIDIIYTLTNEENNLEVYEKNVKKEIDNILTSLPMWCPGARRDQDLLKEGIKNNLLTKIRNLRGIVYSNKPVSVHINDSVNTEPSISTMLFSQCESNTIEKLIESEILDWLMQIKFKESEDIGRTISIIDTTDIFARRLMPLLTKPTCTRNYKFVLKSLILDTLNGLPNVLQFPKNKRLYLNRIAEELTNRLIYIQVKCRNSHSCCMFPRERNMYQVAVSRNSEFRRSLLEGLNVRLDSLHLYPRINIIEDVIDILFDFIDSISYDDFYKRDDISEIVQTSLEQLETQAPIFVNDGTIESLRNALTKDMTDNAKHYIPNVRPCHSSTISVYTSEQDLSGHPSYPITSTPKRKPKKKEIVKQNPEETAYTIKISEIIRKWTETLPKTLNEDKKFKETAIMDLAGDIVDQMKLEQLVPSNDADKNRIMTYTICRWLYRFDIFGDRLSEDAPQIRDLEKSINEVPVPNLTRPRHGNRQAIANTKINESDRDFFIPKGTDVLEDEISIWINEQPSDFYSKKDRNKIVHDLAQTLHNRLNKKNDEEIHNDISKWMNKNLKSSKRKSIDKLTENLKNRIINLPQDDTLKENLNVKIREQLQKEAARLNPEQAPVPMDTTLPPPDVDTDRTLKEFIAKYMEHNYDVDDSVARGAFGELLKTEIRKLNPPTRKEVYENFSKPHDELSTDRLDKELQYIKLVSDWLKNIPIESTFNTPHNKERINIVNDLSRNIYEVEEERRRAPTAMDYDMYLASIISQTTNILPILPGHSGNVMFMIDELVGKIKDNRAHLSCCQNANQTLASINTSGILEQNVSEFIDNYIHLNAGEFAEDQLKMDAWTARIYKELKKIVNATADPSTLCQAQIYSKLISVPIPGDESVKLFSLELDYAKEITDWLNNMPLIPLQSQAAINERVKMISELAEQFSERDRNRLINPSEHSSDVEIEEYISNWIKRIPLNPRKEIVVPILVQQLLKRIERVNSGKQEISTLPETTTNQTANTSKKRQSNSSKSQSERPKCKPSGNAGKPGQVVVKAIENWSNNLPVRANTKDEEKTIKDEIACKLYQKVGALSVDPHVMNDDLLFKEILADEVNIQLKSLSNNADIHKKKEGLKNELVDKVMEAKIIVHENVAGENYKQHLENTIEASIPNPITNKQWYDPGFEIYKNRLADMFILDNFDHGNGAVKIKYERKIRDEVDKYFENAQKRNVVPLSKDEIYNELYGALFKVPIPNEESVMKEVEEVKTRVEIDIWFEGLPIREASGLNELLEWDKILSMLAKRLHDVEKNEQNPEEKMHKEIVKWVVRFPLLTGQDKNADKFADDLQNRLKTSKESRKCVTSSTKGKEIKKLPQPKVSLGNKSQAAGPSSEGQMWTSCTATSPKTSCQSSPSGKKPAELILEIVEVWCEQIALPALTPQDQINNKIILDNLLTKIIMKICELNGNPQTFNDELLYEYLLDAELETLMSDLPICQSENTKNSKKLQLKEAIKSVLPLMREERACYEYKQELKSTINNVLEEPLNTTADKEALFNQLKDEIVDNFVQYHYNRDNDEGKQIYKSKLHDIVMKFLQDIQENLDGPPVDPLIRQNQLICELAKVPIPCERAINDEVQEIRMKDEVKTFFDELDLPDETEDRMALRNNVKLSLAKRLNDIEKTGHTSANDTKMKKDIMRCLMKIDVEVSPQKIDAFINKLKDSELIRKAPPLENKAIVPSAPIHESHLKTSNKGQVCNPNISDGRPGRGVGVARVDYQGSRGIPVSVVPAYPQPSLQNIQIPLAVAPLNCGPKEQLAVGETQANQDQVQPPLRTNTRRGAHTSYEDNGVCKCGRNKRRFKGRPRCILRMEDYCIECERFCPMWMPMSCRMPPECFYY